MANYYYLETGSTDPYYNLAFEETILETCILGNYLILWKNDNTIVIGQNQNAEAEIDRDFVEKHDIKLVRRMTGGGAVYHDLGNLNYSFITDGSSPDDAKVFLSIVTEALRSLGLPAETSGRNDILVGGKKVSGTASRLHHGRLLFHGTLLFDSDLEMVAGALRADPAKFQGKGIRSVRSRIGNIRPMLPRDMTLDAFKEILRDALTKGPFIPLMLSSEELVRIEELRNDKYSTEAWNWGRSPAGSFHRKRRYAGGTIEIAADICDDCLHNVRFMGDYLAMLPQESLCRALENCQLRREELKKIFDDFDASLFFGSITADEVIDTILDY